MPRIAAVLGVWIAVIFALGFNVAHYPIVREFIPPPTGGVAAATPAPSPAPAAETQKPQNESSADRAAPSATEPATDRAAPSEAPGAAKQVGKYRVQCDGKSCKLVPEEESAKTAEKTETAKSPKPAQEAEPSKASEPATAKTAPAAKEAADTQANAKKPGEVSFTPVAQVVVPTTPPAMAPQSSRTRRLPALDKVWTPPMATATQNAGRIPMYATTGID